MPKTMTDPIIPAGDNVYITRNTSALGSFILFMMLMLALFLPMVIFVASPGVVTGIIAVAVAAGLIYGAIHTKQKIEITVLQDRLLIRYISKPFFDRVQDREILLSEIASYKTASFQGNFFTLYMKEGPKFRIALSTMNNSDSFAPMTDHIIKVIKERNRDGMAEPIANKGSIYEGRSGIVLIVIAAAAILAFIYAMIFLPDRHSTADTVRGIGIVVTMLGMIAYIISLRYKKKSEEE